MSGPDPRVRNQEIEQAQLRGFARSFSEIEWLLLILVTLYLFVTRPDAARDVVVVGILVAFAVFIIVFRYSSFLATRMVAKIGVEILVMIAFLTAVLAVSGSERAALTNLYLLPIITAALALGRRATTLVLVLIIVCYLLLQALEQGYGALDAAFATEVASVLGPFVLVAFLTILLAENIHIAKERIRALADHDELTALYNMRAFNKLAQRHAELARQAQGNYAVLMIDIKGLKSINDGFGNEAGDKAIRLVTDALVRLTRTSDIVARYGGDEFAALLANADPVIAREVAQRIRNVVFATTLEVDSRIVRVQVGVGIGCMPDDGGTLQEVMAAAGRDLYKDKEGREKPSGRLVIQKR
ncbi:MAG TPA: GGDEF domain-containing protein [Gammaproteobacteria bacterium]|nr:GGDEF domain-containing protein [Gammaproteobacteria bacterium]